MCVIDAACIADSPYIFTAKRSEWMRRAPRNKSRPPHNDLTGSVILMRRTRRRKRGRFRGAAARRGRGRSELNHRASFVDDVDRLVRQEAVGDVPRGETHRRRERVVVVRHAVVRLVRLWAPARESRRRDALARPRSPLLALLREPTARPPVRAIRRNLR